MLIHEVCQKCSLTKKAVDYYEKQKLIQPKVGENGYRHYSENDLLLLKEISLLRRLGLIISEIKDILESSNKSVTLIKYKYLLDLKKQKVTEQQTCLDQMIQNYDIEKGIEYLDSNHQHMYTIKEKLVQAFPGVYGMYLAIHFGPFLNERMDCAEQEEAYTKIVHFIDNISISEETETYLENAFPPMEQQDMEDMSSTLVNAVEDLEDFDRYMAINEKSIEDYMKFRTSEAYKSTPAYKMQQLILEFQQSSGYEEIFIKNLKILSSSYHEYTKKLQEANERFVQKYPQTANWYQK